MQAKIHYNLLFNLVFIVAITLSSCITSFPTAETPVNCNGQMLTPLKNPTIRPIFPGGHHAMHNFLENNINHSQETKVKGKVRVAFIVTKKGEICDVRITSKPKKYIDNEIIRVIKMMPKWTPGTNEGETIDSYYLLEIKF